MYRTILFLVFCIFCTYGFAACGDDSTPAQQPNPTETGSTSTHTAGTTGTSQTSTGQTSTHLPPHAHHQTVATLEDQSVDITLEGSDPEGQPITFETITQPDRGTLSGTAPHLTYTPEPDHFGDVTFSFTVSDGEFTSEPAQVTVSISPVNDPPQAQAETLSTPEDTPLNLTLQGSDVDGDPLTFEIATPPIHGTLLDFDPASGGITYVPNAQFSGEDSFEFTVFDGVQRSSLGRIAVSVDPLNDVPTAYEQSQETLEDTPLSILLLGEDLDGDEISFSIATSPQHGTLSALNPQTGEVTYTPNPNYNGADAFTFAVSDADSTSQAASVELTISATNDAPNAETIERSLDEDTPVTIELSATDADLDPLTFRIENTPQHGILSELDPESNTVVYTPNPNYNGPDSFAFTASDGITTSNQALVELTVEPVNDPPTSAPQTRSTLEDTPLTWNLLGSDVDEDPVTFALEQPPTRGEVSIQAQTGEATYTPNPNFTGEDSFTFIVSDGQDSSPTATVTLRVGIVNDPPTAQAQTATTAEDSPLNIILTGEDIEQDTLTFRILEPPQRGVLSELNAETGEVTYTPNVDYNGTDSFSFIANDTIDDSTPATIQLTIVPVNDPPTALPRSSNTQEDTPSLLQLTGTDTENDPLTFEIALPPSHGVLSELNAETGEVTYTPNADYNGPDSFSFMVSDGQITSFSATYTITVEPINDPPTGQAQQRIVREDTPAMWTLQGDDVDGDPLTFTIVQNPLHGSISNLDANTGTFIYTPNTHYNGSDTIEFAISDGIATSQPIELSIVIEPVNDAPQASTVALESSEDTPVTSTLVATDPDGDPLTFLLTAPPTHGDVQLDAETGEFTYTPTPNYNGSDAFGFAAQDGSLTSEHATVHISIDPVNDAPTAFDQRHSLQEDISSTYTLQGDDIDSDPITFAIIQPPQHTTVSNFDPATGQLTFTPNAHYNGTDQLTFTISDGQSTSPPYTLSLTILPSNDPPTVSNTEETGHEDTPFTAQLTATDIDNDPLTYTIASPPQHGQAELNAETGEVIYTPNANYNGPDQLTFTASDGDLSSQVATVSLTIAPVNDPPTAIGQSRTTLEDTPLVWTLQGDDIDNDSLTFAVATPPSNGQLTINAETGEATYTPNANFTGPDSFTFTVSDSNTTSSPAQVNLDIGVVNDAPTADAQTVATAEDTTLDITLTGSDLEGDPISFTIATQPQHGTLDVPIAGAALVRYTPNADYNGTDSFSFRTNDGRDDSPPANVQITVTPVNDAPSAQDQQLTTQEDTPLPLQLTGTDVDDDLIQFEIITPPNRGTLTNFDPVRGTATYTPNMDYNGTDSLSFRVNDSALSSHPQTVQITVQPTNDPPRPQNDVFTTHEDDQPTINVLNNDSDPENQPIRITRINATPITVNSPFTLPSGASVTLLPDGRFSYQSNGIHNNLNVGQSSTDSFSYTIADTDNAETSANASITFEGTSDLVAFDLPNVVSSNIRMPLVWTLTGPLPDGTYCEIDFNDDGVFDIDSRRGEIDCNQGFAELAIPGFWVSFGFNRVRLTIHTPYTTLTATDDMVFNNPITNPQATLPDEVWAGWQVQYAFQFTPNLSHTSYSCFLDTVENDRAHPEGNEVFDCSQGLFSMPFTHTELDPKQMRAYVIVGDRNHFLDDDPNTQDFQLLPLSDVFELPISSPFEIVNFDINNRPDYYIYHFYRNFQPSSHTLTIINEADQVVYSAQLPSSGSSTSLFDYPVGQYRILWTARSGEYVERREGIINKESIIVARIFDEGAGLPINTWVVTDDLNISGYDGWYIQDIDVQVFWRHSELDWMDIAIERGTIAATLYGDSPANCDLDDPAHTYQIVNFSDRATIGGGHPDYCSTWTKSDHFEQHVVKRRPIHPLSRFRTEPVNGNFKLYFSNPHNRGSGNLYAWYVEIWPSRTPPTFRSYKPRGHMRLDQNRSWSINIDNMDGFTVRDLDINVLMNYANAYWYTKYRFNDDTYDSQPHDGAAPTRLDSGILEIFLRHVDPDGNEAFMQVYSNKGWCNDIFDNNLGHECYTTNFWGVEVRSGDCKDNTWTSIGFRDSDSAHRPYVDPDINNPELYYCPDRPRQHGNAAQYFGGPHDTLRVEPDDFGGLHRPNNTFDVFNGRPVNGLWELQVHRYVVGVDTETFYFSWDQHLGREGDGDLWGWDLNITFTPPGCNWIYSHYERDFVLSCP